MCQQVSGCPLDAHAADDFGVELWKKRDLGSDAEKIASGRETKWEIGTAETVDVMV